MNDRSDQLRSLRIERSQDDSGQSEGGGAPRWLLPTGIAVAALVVGGLAALAP